MTDEEGKIFGNADFETVRLGRDLERIAEKVNIFKQKLQNIFEQVLATNDFCEEELNIVDNARKVLIGNFLKVFMEGDCEYSKKLKKDLESLGSSFLRESIFFQIPYERKYRAIIFVDKFVTEVLKYIDKAIIEKEKMASIPLDEKVVPFRRKK